MTEEALIDSFSDCEIHEGFANRLSQVVAEGGQVERSALDALRAELPQMVDEVRTLNEARSMIFTLVSIVAGFELAGQSEVADELSGLLDSLTDSMKSVGQRVGRGADKTKKLEQFSGTRAPEPVPEGPSTKAGPLARFVLGESKD